MTDRDTYNKVGKYETEGGSRDRYVYFGYGDRNENEYETNESMKSEHGIRELHRVLFDIQLTVSVEVSSAPLDDRQEVFDNVTRPERHEEVPSDAGHTRERSGNPDTAAEDRADNREHESDDQKKAFVLPDEPD